MRLLDVVGHQQHGARLGGQRAGQPLLHVGAGDGVQRGEGLVEQQHRPAGQQRAQEGHALAHAAGERGGPRPLELGQPEALEQRRGALARLARGARPGTRAPARRCRARRARAAAGRAGACRRRPRGGRAASVAPAGRRPSPRRAPAGRPPARAAWTCRSPSGPTTATTSRGRTVRSTPSSAATSAPRRRQRRRAGAPHRVLQSKKRLRRGSLGLALHRSLRGHYPTGSKGQRRAAVVEGAISARLPRAPLVVDAGESTRPRHGAAPRSRSRTLSSCLVVQHSNTPSQCGS